MAKKLTDVRVYERRKNVLDMLLKGKSHTDIQTYIQNRYGVGHKAVEADITIAYKTLSLDFAKDTEDLINKHVAMYYGNYQLALDIGDIKASNQSLQFIEKLRGLHRPDTQILVQNNTQNNTFIPMDQLTFEQLQAIVNGKQGDSHQIGT